MAVQPTCSTQVRSRPSRKGSAHWLRSHDLKHLHAFIRCACWLLSCMQVTDALHVMLLCCRVFCGHHDWVEGVLVCQAKDNAYDQSFMSFSADGHVCCWELDAEQNCDVFRQVVSTTRLSGQASRPATHCGHAE
jgi:hypothetical protein